ASDGPTMDKPRMKTRMLRELLMNDKARVGSPTAARVCAALAVRYSPGPESARQRGVDHKGGGAGRKPGATRCRGATGGPGAARPGAAQREVARREVARRRVARRGTARLLRTALSWIAMWLGAAGAVQAQVPD